MYKYNDIAFRVVEHNDLEILRALHNDPSTYLNLFNIDLATKSKQEEWWKNIDNKWIKENDNGRDKRCVICLAEKKSTVIGRLRIQNISQQHNNCEVGLDIIKEYRGRKYGIKSYEMILEFLFNHLNMNMIYLKVADFNPIAKNLYKKVGFEETGKFEQFFYRHGKYWDYIVMSITKQRYIKKYEDSNS